MSVLVAYASKHGATRGIAERIADRLRAAGQEAKARPVEAASDLAGYDAFVIGSAAYMGRWRKDAVELVRRNRDLLASRPVWLFSSGPLGKEALDAQGRDKRESAVPTEIAEFREAIKPRDHRVFFGALSPTKLGFGERLIRMLPAGRALLPEGDFRDWQDIDGWAESIVQELAQAPASRR